MSLQWREGMHREVKERLLSMLCAWEGGELKEDSLRYLRHSQFYKIFINKMGSRSTAAQNQYQKQQEYFSSVSAQLQAISGNISSFMFGFKQPPSNQPVKPSQLPPTAANEEEFKTLLDKHIEREISQHLQALHQKYNSKKLVELKQRAEQLITHSPQSEQAFQQDYAAYEQLLLQAMNVNCLKQVLEEIQATANTILAFRSELAQKTAGIHGAEVLRKLYQFSLSHPETEYNSVQNK